MNFTGERYIPTEQGIIRLEHYHRYAVISELITGKKVLDIASGEGYGSALIAQVANFVVGVDISYEAIAHARSTYQNITNLQFIEGSAALIPVDNASFDVVVSFETIEHLTEQDDMLAEIKRVLRPNGVLIISSPNRPVYSEENGRHNEFHLRELDFNELDKLLKKQFSQVCYYGQRIAIGSIIQSTVERADAYSAWHDDGLHIKSKSTILQRPVYFLAICGYEDTQLPTLKASIIYSEKTDLYENYRSRLLALNNEVIRRGKEIESYYSQALEFANQIQSLQNQLMDSTQVITHRDTELQAYQHQALEFANQIQSLQEQIAVTVNNIAIRDSKLLFYQQDNSQLADSLNLIKMQRKNENSNWKFLVKCLITLFFKKFK